jgi:hypothetical protein
MIIAVTPLLVRSCHRANLSDPACWLNLAYAATLLMFPSTQPRSWASVPEGVSETWVHVPGQQRSGRDHRRRHHWHRHLQRGPRHLRPHRGEAPCGYRPLQPPGGSSTAGSPPTSAAASAAPSTSSAPSSAAPFWSSPGAWATGLAIACDPTSTPIGEVLGWLVHCCAPHTPKVLGLGLWEALDRRPSARRIGPRRRSAARMGVDGVRVKTA